MKTAYVSLHTQKPSTQSEFEIFYEGYKRVEIQYDEESASPTIEILFPIIEADTEDKMTWAVIGGAETGDGEIFLRMHMEPMELKTDPRRLTTEFWLSNGATPDQAVEYVKNYGHIAPRVIMQRPAKFDYPENLNPIARIFHQLVYSGCLNIDTVHPKVYEAINDALHNAGVPVIPVVRASAATINAKLSQMPSLNLSALH